MNTYSQIVVQVSDVLPYKQNAREHSVTQVQQICKSIQEFGFTNPILIDDKNNLIAGHGRLEAAEKLKLKEVPAVVITDLTEEKRKALIIADNKIAANATWDIEMLVSELQQLSPDYQSLVGFSSDELATMLGTVDDDMSEVDESFAEDKFQLLIEFDNEDQLAEAYANAKDEGLECKIIM